MPRRPSVPSLDAVTVGKAKVSVGPKLGDLFGRGPVRVGDKCGTATVTSVSGPEPKVREAAAKMSGRPWGRFVEGDERRVVMAFSIPPRTLSANASRSGVWQVKAKAAREHRAVATDAAADAVGAIGLARPWAKATLRACWYCRTRNHPDDDNATARAKNLRDGLIDGGLIEGDDPARLRQLPAMFRVDRENPRLELTIERAR